MENTNNRKFFNDGPLGERDYEDAGNRYIAPRLPLSVGKAPTAAQLKVIRAKEDVIIARMVAEYTKSKGFAPNALEMMSFSRAASCEAKN